MFSLDPPVVASHLLAPVGGWTPTPECALRIPASHDHRRDCLYSSDTEITERGRSVLVMRARYRSTGLTPHQRGWTDAG